MRLIDADELLKNRYLTLSNGTIFGSRTYVTLEEIENAPTINVSIEAPKEPEIVRCKDCEYCDIYPRNDYRCTRMGNYRYVDSDFFCAAGRRRGK